ncbi:SAM-dependent methyltransferase [Streptomyces lavendulae]|uniref:SAM-dependent methyltransferase n=1 Tax=Streptomyces lavendulae TaxID=1914 RepID=UPI0031EC0C2B
MTKAMAQNHVDGVGAMYDLHTDLFAEVLGGSMHVGYWSGAEDARPLAAASAHMTGLVAERLALTPGQQVLDVGCGNGKPAVQVAADHGVHVTGITVSAYQVRLARERPYPADRPGQVSFQLADATKLPDDDASFDSAYAIESLLHMDDKDAALGQLARVLRPGARLVIADFCLDALVGERDAQLIAHMREIFRISAIPTMDDYSMRLRRAGFTVLDLTDVRENVRRTYDLVAQGFRQTVGQLDGELAAQLAGSATVIDQIGAVQPLGYLLITAVRQ